METPAFPDPAPGAIVRHPIVSPSDKNVEPAAGPAAVAQENRLPRKPRRRLWRFVRLAFLALLVPVLVGGAVSLIVLSCYVGWVRMTARPMPQEGQD